MDIIQSLWVGDSLTNMEKMSLNSFLYNGHEVHLYAYYDIKNVPEKVIIKDAREILPENLIVKCSEDKSYGAFSDLFRHKLLLDKGNFWCDTDVICIKPFNFSDEYVFSTEQIYNGSNIFKLASCVIKCPANSEFAKFNFNFSKTKDLKTMPWGDIGPKLVGESVNKFNLHKFVKGYKAFCPIFYDNYMSYLSPDGQTSFGEETYAIHLWNEMWRRNNTDKNKEYDKNCLYEILKKRYL